MLKQWFVIEGANTFILWSSLFNLYCPLGGLLEISASVSAKIWPIILFHTMGCLWFTTYCIRCVLLKTRGFNTNHLASRLKRPFSLKLHPNIVNYTGHSICTKYVYMTSIDYNAPWPQPATRFTTVVKFVKTSGECREQMILIKFVFHDTVIYSLKRF